MTKYQAVFLSGGKQIGFYPVRDTKEEAQRDIDNENDKNKVFKYNPYDSAEIVEWTYK